MKNIAEVTHELVRNGITLIQIQEYKALDRNWDKPLKYGIAIGHTMYDEKFDCWISV